MPENSNLNTQDNEIINDFLHFKGKDSKEEMFETTNIISGGGAAGYRSSIFLFLSNINGLNSVLTQYSKYIFPLAFAFNALDWLFSALEYSNSSNKKIEKLSDLIFKSIEVILIGLATFGLALVGAHFVAIFFACACGVNLAVNLVKGFGFLVAGFFAKKEDKAAKDFYYKKATEAFVNAAATAIALAVIVVVLVLSIQLVPLVPILGLCAGVAILGVSIYGIYNRAKAYLDLSKAKRTLQNDSQIVLNSSDEQNTLNSSKEKPSITPKLNKSYFDERRHSLNPTVNREDVLSEEIDPSASKQMTVDINELKINHLLSDTGYFHHTIRLAESIDNHHELELVHLYHHIEIQIAKLRQAINNESTVRKLLWNQNAKRQKKIDALEYLLELIHHMGTLTLASSKEETIFLKGIQFKFKTMQELIHNFDKFIMDTCSGAFQSFFRDTGKTEALFKFAYKLLLSPETHATIKIKEDIRPAPILEQNH